MLSAKYRRILIVYKSRAEVARRFQLNRRYVKQEELMLCAEVICGRDLAIVTVPRCNNCHYCRGIGIKVVDCGWWEGNVKRAQKDNPVVKKGESYWWWKFRYGSKRYSKERPKASQLTQSAFLSQLYTIEETIAAMSTIDDIENMETVIEEIGCMRDECEYSLENMPEHLQETSDSGQLLQQRMDDLDVWLQELESIELEMDDELDDAKIADRVEEIIAEIQSIGYSGE
jgi:hypothetical protein